MQTKSCLMMTTMWIVLVCAMGNLCFGQSYWKKTYGGAEDDLCGTCFLHNSQTILPTSEGNYLLLGATQSFGGGQPDSWLIKIKPNGDTIWTKTLGGSNGGMSTAIFSTTVDNFLITGFTFAERNDICLIKIKPNGDTIWTKTFGESNLGQNPIILPTNDGNYLFAAGWTSSIDTPNQDIHLIKIKPNGDTIWTKTFGTTNEDYCNAIFPTADSNFLLAGQTSVMEKCDFWLIKIKPNGDTIWTRTFHGTNYQWSNMIFPTKDSNFLLVGNINFFGADNNDVGLIKIKMDGSTIWTKTFGVTNGGNFNKILPTIDGNFLLGGCTAPFSGGDSGDIWLIKINPDGSAIWTKTYGGTKADYFNTILPTADGNFLLGGTTMSFGRDSGDIWLIKIKPNGDTLWTRTFGGSNLEMFLSILSTSDGNYLINGGTKSFGAGGLDSWLLCLIADQYAYKNAFFTYKIPTYGEDTLNFGYTPLKVPSGMTVSTGGTISWTPTTDSVYMDHAEFQVLNDAGRKDTLTFNIFVNSNYHANASIKPTKFNKTTSKSFKIDTKLSNGKIKFSLPSSVTSLCIYDINGRIVDKITPTISGSEICASWPTTSAGSTKFPTGKYFAKVSVGKNTAVKPFLFCR
jgi:hypothetical protein